MYMKFKICDDNYLLTGQHILLDLPKDIDYIVENGNWNGHNFTETFWVPSGTVHLFLNNNNKFHVKADFHQLARMLESLKDLREL